MVVRDPERAQQMTAAWGVPAHPSLHALLAAGPGPDFLVLTVTRNAAPLLVAGAGAAGLPVLAGAPAAAGLAGLVGGWEVAGAGARIQVAEQFPFHPWHAARLALVRSGRLG